MNKQEQLLKMIARVRTTLADAYGDKFTALSEKERTNVIICILHDLAKRDKNIMDTVAAAIYEMSF